MPIIVDVRGEEVTVTLQELGRNPTLRMLIERVNAHWRGWKSKLPPDIQQYSYRDRQFKKDDLNTPLDKLGIKEGTTLIGSTVQPGINSERDLSPRAAGVVSDGTFDGLPEVMQQSIGDYVPSSEIDVTGLKDVFKLDDARIKKKQGEEFNQIIDPVRKKDPDKYKKYDEIINFLEGLDFPEDWSLRNKLNRDDFLQKNGLWEKYKDDRFLAQLSNISDLPLFKTNPDEFLEIIIKSAQSFFDYDCFNFLVYWALKCGTLINKRMSNGEIPLIDLLRYPKEASLLLECGANANSTNKNGETALMVACARGYINMVEVLLNKSAAVNHVTTKDKSALMFACNVNIPNSLTVVKRLLEHKADINCVNNERGTAYSIAKQHGRINIMKLLKPYQAKDENKIGHITMNLTSPGSSGTFRQKRPIPSEEKSKNPKEAHAIIKEDTLDEMDTIINSMRCKYDYNRGDEFIAIKGAPGDSKAELCILRDQFNALFQQRAIKGATAKVEDQLQPILIIKGIDLTELRNLINPQEPIKPPVASSTCIIS